MSVFTNVVKKYKRATPKQLLLSGVFMLALAGAIGGGFASKQFSSAATGRDENVVNSIDNSSNGGGVGALSNSEFISDVRYNHPSDLQSIYSAFGLSASDYDRFVSEARPGMALQDGTVVVDGETVMHDAWSIGRTKFSYAHNYWIGDKLYYWSWDTKVLKSNLPVMVLFDKDGTVQIAVIQACGNPIGGVKVTSGAECKDLIKTPVDGEENTYTFSTNANKWGLAKYAEFNYYYNDGSGDKLFATTHSPSETVKKTFTKSATVTVRITINLPGGKTKIVTGPLCSKQVGVVKKEVLHVCESLVASSTDNITFRFTVSTKQSSGVTVKSADFTLDNSTTTKDVTTKDASGNIYREYTFDDTNKHTVGAVVNFLVDGKIVRSTEDCKASVQRNKTPECKPGIPEGDVRCTPECKPGIPVGDSRCEELPSTGPAGMTGLFAGVSALGAAAHRVFIRRRAHRS